MNFPGLKVTEVLRISDAELYETSNENGSLLTKGPLYVLYSQEHNFYILKLNDFNYGLSKDIPVLASDKEPDAVRAYVLLNQDSFYVIKLTQAAKSEIAKLEEILKNNSEFAYKEGPKGHGIPVTLTTGTVKVNQVGPNKPEEAEKTESKPFDAAQYVYEGGKSLRRMMVGGASSVAGGIKNFGEYVDKNYIPEKAEQAPVDPATQSRLNKVNSVTGTVGKITGFWLRGIMYISHKIAGGIESQFEKKEGDKEKQVEEQRSGNIAYAAIHSAISMWHGMAEALDIISTEAGDTASHLVKQKYGPTANEYLKAGVNVVGATGRVPSLPGKKYLKNAHKA